MKNVAPWMVALIAFAALFPTVRHPAPPSAPEKPAAPAVADVAAKKKDDAPAKTGPGEAPPPAVVDPCHPGAGSSKELPPRPAWCESLRVLRENLGLEPSSHGSREESLEEISETIGQSDLRLRFMVALVADPLESGQPIGFDSALDSLQEGFAETGYRFNRFWLPWKDETGKRERWYREEPGIVLFQKTLEDGRTELAAVFLVGEAPKAGIQRRAFREALDIAWWLGAERADWKVAVLGPSFSGSTASLRSELDWAAGSSLGGFQFSIATGSATADGLENELLGYEFCRTVVPERALRQETFHFLAHDMGWRLQQTALLAEADTAFGQSLWGDKEVTKDLLLIRFPSHIADVRTAWQRDAAQFSDETKVKIGDALVPIGKPALKVNPDDLNEPVDVVPNFSSLTTPEKDLELSNVLQTISRDGIRYVGILATDVNDKLFLAGEIHRSSPDSILFTFENNLLFAHPEYGQVMDGTLVASSAPLFTEGARWLPGSTPTDSTPARAVRRRRQFESESQEGTLAATRFLLGDYVPPRPRIWISVVGNGSLWPLRVLPVSADTARYCPVPEAGKGAASSVRKPEVEPRWGSESWLSGRTNLQVLAFAGWLCLLSFLLERTGFLKGCPAASGRTVACTPVDRRLLLCGAALLAVSAGVVLVVGSIPEWATYLWGEKRSYPYWELRRFLYLVPLAAIYVYLAAKFYALLPRRGGVVFAAWLLGLLFFPFLLIVMLIDLWMPGGEIAFFQLRALTLGSGLSPLVSLGLLVSALCAWIFCEIARHRLVTEMKTAWPREALREDALAGCDKILESIESWQERAFPPSRRLWILIASLFLPPDLLLWSTIQPVAETRTYGRLFLLFFMVAGVLALVSFARFYILWRRLLLLLRRLRYLSPEWRKTFEKLAPELDWQATRTFAFRLPRFKMLALATDKLTMLPNRWWDAGEVADALRRYYQSEAEGVTLEEKLNRRQIEGLLEEAGSHLDTYVEDPQVRAFFAVRMVAHLRYHFAHLRNSLMAATVMGILILVAVTSYFFEPKQFVSLTIWGTLSVGVALTFWSFLQMDRDETLSAIGGTKPGQISFDKAFFANLTLYVLVPALSVVATQFPEVGRLLGRVADQFLRVAGGG